MRIDTSKLIARYLCWFIGIALLSFSLRYISDYFYIIGLFGCLIVPTDRVRIYLVRAYNSVPDVRQAWTLIFFMSILPFSFGVYSASVSELNGGVHRANAVVGGIFFWGMFTFGLNALLYRNNKMWLRAKSRLTKRASGTV